MVIQKIVWQPRPFVAASFTTTFNRIFTSCITSEKNDVWVYLGEFRSKFFMCFFLCHLGHLPVYLLYKIGSFFQEKPFALSV